MSLEDLFAYLLLLIFVLGCFGLLISFLDWLLHRGEDHETRLRRKWEREGFALWEAMRKDEEGEYDAL